MVSRLWLGIGSPLRLHESFFAFCMQSFIHLMQELSLANLTTAATKKKSNNLDFLRIPNPAGLSHNPD